MKIHNGAQCILKYAVCILRPRNDESGGPELNNIGWKCQYKNWFILFCYLIDTIFNQIMDIIK